MPVTQPLNTVFATKMLLGKEATIRERRSLLTPKRSTDVMHNEPVLTEQLQNTGPRFLPSSSID